MNERKPSSGHLSITVNDVARMAGVSAMTVSRVLNRPGTVQQATAQKVLDAVAATGYVPNRVAGGLRSSRTRLVAALVPTLSGPIFLETIEALNLELGRQGYQLMVGQSGYHESREDALLAEIIGRRPDGIVLTGVSHTAESRRRLQASGIPVVETWDLSLDPIDLLVGFSHELAGRKVASYLHGKGRRRLAVIGGDDLRSERRAGAFVAQALSQGLQEPPVRYIPAPARLGAARRALNALLQEAPAIDAIFCSSDLMAIGVMTEARALGRAVPADLAVVGFGDQNFAVDLDPALTTVHIDARRIGELAAQCIVARAEGAEVPQRVIDVGFEIVERDSA